MYICNRHYFRSHSEYVCMYVSTTIYLHSVSYVYAVLPFYDVKCLCSGGRE